MSHHNETTHYFKMASALCAARRAGDRQSGREAVDELEVLAMHTSNPKLRSQALGAVAQHRASIEPSHS